MTTKLVLKEILQKAVHKEIESRQLYNRLSQQMTDKGARDAFNELAQQEQRHRELLEQYIKGELTEGALDISEMVDYRIAEHFDQPEISPDMKLKDVFLLAANREKASHELYLSLAYIHPSGKVKTLFEGLAAQELGHKQRVEFLYTEVAFPQTDGG